MFRRSFVVLLALTLVFPVFSGRKALASDMDGWALALKLVEKETGYTADQLEKYSLVYGDGVWSFSVIVKDHPEDEKGLIVGQMDAWGNQISLELPTKISLNEQLERGLKSCFNRDDCYLLLAHVCEKWQKRLKDASEEVLSSLWEKYLAVVKMGITLPADNALAYNTAMDMAKKHLVPSLGWTDEMTEMFRLSISAHYLLDQRPVYFFYYEQHSYFEPEYESERAMKRYEKQLEQIFSCIGQEAPQRIGILLDAKTGELIEPPMLDYAPVQFHYFDFLIRTEEAVQSVMKRQ